MGMPWRVKAHLLGAAWDLHAVDAYATMTDCTTTFTLPQSAHEVEECF